METSFNKRKERLALFNSLRNRESNKQITKDIPDDLMFKCDFCGFMITSQELQDNNKVCLNCNHHYPLSAYERIDMLVDKDSFIEKDKQLITEMYDDFPTYQDKLKTYQNKTHLNEAVVYGMAKIKSQKIILVVMDNQFMMASMGHVVGEKVTKAIELATKKQRPLIIVCTSGGARMQEGIISLMQMAKTSAALKRFSDNKGFYISILTDPTTGGVSASFAMLGDIIIAEPKALIGFAGKRVIEKTINETLPEDFQKSEMLLEKGFIDLIVERNQLRECCAQLIQLHRG